MSNFQPSSPHRADGLNGQATGLAQPVVLRSPLADKTVEELYEFGARVAFDLLADSQPRPTCRRCRERRSVPGLHGFCDPCNEQLLDIAADAFRADSYDEDDGGIAA